MFVGDLNKYHVREGRGQSHVYKIYTFRITSPTRLSLKYLIYIHTGFVFYALFFVLSFFSKVSFHSRQGVPTPTASVVP